MPELPEVTTTVNGLQKVLPKLKILAVWTDLNKKNQKIKQFKNSIKDEEFFVDFKKKTIGERVINVERRAKNILINIAPTPSASGHSLQEQYTFWTKKCLKRSCAWDPYPKLTPSGRGRYTILIHLKMTGHLLYGKYVYNKKENKWTPDIKEKKALFDPFNKYIHFVLTFSNGKHLAFCDSRKFGKVTLIPTEDRDNTSHLKNIGPEPLDKSFTFTEFKARLLLKPHWKIKTVLMDQSVIAGIGNIYSDEMLWSSGIHPESNPSKIPNLLLSRLYKEMKDVLLKGIDFGGDSMSDYRNIDGLRGEFQHHHNVYQKKNEECGKKGCKGVIMRKVINGRSAHFCNAHQKLFN